MKVEERVKTVGYCLRQKYDACGALSSCWHSTMYCSAKLSMRSGGDINQVPRKWHPRDEVFDHPHAFHDARGICLTVAPGRALQRALQRRRATVPGDRIWQYCSMPEQMCTRVSSYHAASFLGS